MPLTLDEVQSLVTALGVQVPPNILADKARAHEFKERCQKLIAESSSKPPDWRLKGDFDGTVHRAAESAKSKQFDAAFKLLDEAGQLLQQPDAPPAPPPVPEPAAPNGQLLAGWQQARASAITQLRNLGAAIKAAQDPEADKALIVLEAVAKNLTESPSTAHAVQELQRYLETDDVVIEAELPNPFGITINVRGPLLAALAPVKTQLATGI